MWHGLWHSPDAKSKPMLSKDAFLAPVSNQGLDLKERHTNRKTLCSHRTCLTVVELQAVSFLLYIYIKNQAEYLSSNFPFQWETWATTLMVSVTDRPVLTRDKRPKSWRSWSSSRRGLRNQWATRCSSHLLSTSTTLEHPSPPHSVTDFCSYQNQQRSCKAWCS